MTAIASYRHFSILVQANLRAYSERSNVVIKLSISIARHDSQKYLVSKATCVPKDFLNVPTNYDLS